MRPAEKLHGDARRVRRLFSTRRLCLVVPFIVMGSLTVAIPAKANHILVHTVTASKCLPAKIACASIRQEWRYHAEPDNTQFTVSTAATGSARILPGTLEASLTEGAPNAPPSVSDEGACSWSVGSTKCSVSLASIGLLPTGGCQPIRVALVATARAIDDPLLRQVPVTAAVTQTLSICPDGTITVL